MTAKEITRGYSSGHSILLTVFTINNTILREVSFMEAKKENKKSFETDRLIIRPSIWADCKLFGEWESTPEVREFFSMEDGRDYNEVLFDYIQFQGDDTKEQYTIVLKESAAAIGRIYLSRIDRHADSLDITRIYIGDPALRNKGYGREAIMAILEYSFSDLNMERVTIDHFSANEAARHLYRKIGFKDEGVMRHSAKKNGKYYDLCLMSMLRSEYKELSD